MSSAPAPIALRPAHPHRARLYRPTGRWKAASPPDNRPLALRRRSGERVRRRRPCSPIASSCRQAAAGTNATPGTFAGPHARSHTDPFARRHDARFDLGELGISRHSTTFLRAAARRGRGPWRQARCIRHPPPTSPRLVRARPLAEAPTPTPTPTWISLSLSPARTARAPQLESNLRPHPH